METREQIIKLAKEAIAKGFGNYYAVPGATWHDIKNGIESGRVLAPHAVEVLMYTAKSYELVA